MIVFRSPQPLFFQGPRIGLVVFVVPVNGVQDLPVVSPSSRHQEGLSVGDRTGTIHEKGERGALEENMVLCSVEQMLIC